MSSRLLSRAFLGALGVMSLVALMVLIGISRHDLGSSSSLDHRRLFNPVTQQDDVFQEIDLTAYPPATEDSEGTIALREGRDRPTTPQPEDDEISYAATQSEDANSRWTDKMIEDGTPDPGGNTLVTDKAAAGFYGEGAGFDDDTEETTTAKEERGDVEEENHPDYSKFASDDPVITLSSNLAAVQKDLQQIYHMVTVQVKAVDPKTMVARVGKVIQTVDMTIKTKATSVLQQAVTTVSADLGNAAITGHEMSHSQVLQLGDVASSFSPFSTYVARAIVNEPLAKEEGVNPLGALTSYGALPNVQDVTLPMWAMFNNPTTKDSKMLMAEPDASVEVGILLSMALTRVIGKAALDTIANTCTGDMYNSCSTGYLKCKDYVDWESHERLRDVRRSQDSYTFNVYDTKPVPTAKQTQRGPSKVPGLLFKGISFEFSATMNANVLAAFSMGSLCGAQKAVEVLQSALSKTALMTVAFTTSAKNMVNNGYIDASGRTVKAHTEILKAVFAAGSECAGSGSGENYILTERPFPPDWTKAPTAYPTLTPTYKPTFKPTLYPTAKPSYRPTYKPTNAPSFVPTAKPSSKPVANPTLKPTLKPSSPKPTVKTTTYKPVRAKFKKPTRAHHQT